VLLQVDGLTPDLLQDYLAEPASRTDRRALHRLLGASDASGGTVRYEAAVAAAQAVTVLPSLADPATASLLTGSPPRVHGVRGPGDSLATGAVTLHEVLRKHGRTSAAAGHPFGRKADFTASGDDDAARTRTLAGWLARQEERPALVTVRFQSLAETLRRRGASGAASALGEIDGFLWQLLYGSGALVAPGTVVVLTSGHGALPVTAGSQALSVDQVSVLVQGSPDARLRGWGGAVLVERPPEHLARDAVQMRPFELAVTRTEDGVLVTDPQLPETRPLRAYDPPHPDLERRLLGAAAPGELLLLLRPPAERAKGFHLLPEGEEEVRVRWGGATAAESVVPLLFAGDPVAAARAAGIGRVAAEDVAPTLLALLGLPPTALGLHRGTSFVSALTPAAGAPVSDGLRACRDAARVGRGFEAACRGHLALTQDRGEAGEALLALTLARHRTQPWAPEDLSAALAVAAWLAPAASWPQGFEEARKHWPSERPACGPLDGGVVVLPGDPPSRAAREAVLALDERRTWELVEEPAQPVVACPLSVPVGVPAAEGHEVAGLVARFAGADAALWGEDNGLAYVTASTPPLRRWAGPAWLGRRVPAVPDRRSLADPASPGSRAATAVAGHAHLARGLQAFRLGFFPHAEHHLAASEGLDELADAWRLAFSRLVRSPESEDAALAKAGRLIGAIDLRVVDGPGRETSLWLVLTEVVVKDGLWVADVLLRRGRARRAPLESAQDKALLLHQAWEPETLLGRYALRLVVALQRSLAILPKLFGGDERSVWKALRGPGVGEALGIIAKDLREESRDLEADLRSSDEVHLLLLALLLAAMEAPTGRLPEDWFENLQAAVRAEAARLAGSVLADVEGANVRALSAFLAGVLAWEDGDLSDVERWATRGRGWSRGTLFERHDYIWGLLRFRALESEDPAGALAELDAVARACPGLAWQLEPARAWGAFSSGEAGALAAACDHLDRYLAGARRRLTGNLTARLRLHARAGSTVASADVEIPLLRLLGTRSDPAKSGAGLGVAGGRPHAKESGWSLHSQGGPREAAATALLMRAWLGLLAGDDRQVGRTLSELQALRQGLDPRWLTERLGEDLPDLPAAGAHLRDPLLALWVGTLAELRGHRRLGDELLRWVASEWAESEEDPPKGVSVCPGDVPEEPEGERLLERQTRCLAPLLAAGRYGANALWEVVHLRTRRLLGRSVPPEPWREALRRASSEAPSLLPGWAPGLDSAWTDRRAERVPDGAGAAAALARLVLSGQGDRDRVVAGGYGCELATQGFSMDGAARAAAVRGAEACGDGPLRLAGMLEAVQAQEDPLVAFRQLLAATDLAGRLPGATLLSRVTWELGVRTLNRIVARAPAEAVGPARQLAAMAARHQDYAIAIDLRTAALAIEHATDAPAGEDPEAVLTDARRWSVANPATAFLKRVSDPTLDAAARKAAALDFLRPSP